VVHYLKTKCEFGTTLDPYAIDNTGNRINTFNINNGGSLLEWLAQIWLWTIPFRVVQKIKIVKIKIHKQPEMADGRWFIWNKYRLK
jgi:hypothetical protein